MATNAQKLERGIKTRALLAAASTILEHELPHAPRPSGLVPGDRVRLVNVGPPYEGLEGTYDRPPTALEDRHFGPGQVYWIKLDDSVEGHMHYAAHPAWVGASDERGTTFRPNGSGAVPSGTRERAPQPASDSSSIAGTPLTTEQRRLLEFALAYGQQRLAAIQRRGYPDWMDRPNRRVLRENPFALLVALALNGQTKADLVWDAPSRLMDCAIVLDPAWIASHRAAVEDAFLTSSPCIHRHRRASAATVLSCADVVLRRYAGDASQLWSGTPGASELRGRFLEIVGVGPAKASFAVGFLFESMGVPVGAEHEMDVKVDRHVERVMRESGIVPDGDHGRIRAAIRAFHPRRPFAVDRGLFWIGAERLVDFSPGWTAPRCAEGSDRAA